MYFLIIFSGGGNKLNIRYCILTGIVHVCSYIASINTHVFIEIVSTFVHKTINVQCVGRQI